MEGVPLHTDPLEADTSAGNGSCPGAMGRYPSGTQSSAPKDDVRECWIDAPGGMGPPTRPPEL